MVVTQGASVDYLTKSQNTTTGDYEYIKAGPDLLLMNFTGKFMIIGSIFYLKSYESRIVHTPVLANVAQKLLLLHDPGHKSYHRPLNGWWQNNRAP